MSTREIWADEMIEKVASLTARAEKAEAELADTRCLLARAVQIFGEEHVPTFEEAWKLMESAGYQYNGEALENVRFGWEIRGKYAGLQEKSEPAPMPGPASDAYGLPNDPHAAKEELAITNLGEALVKFGEEMIAEANANRLRRERAQPCILCGTVHAPGQRECLSGDGGSLSPAATTTRKASVAHVAYVVEHAGRYDVMTIGELLATCWSRSIADLVANAINDMQEVTPSVSAEEEKKT